MLTIRPPAMFNRDGKLDFEEFQAMVANTDVAKQLTLEDLF